MPTSSSVQPPLRSGSPKPAAMANGTPQSPVSMASFDTSTKVKLVVKISALQSLMLFLAIVISGYLNYQRHESIILMNLQNQLQLAANTVATSIDGDAYQTLQGKASVGSVEYVAVKSRLEKFLVNRYLGFEDNHIYTFRRVMDDSVEFTAMLQEAFVGDRYPINQKMREVFTEGHPRYTGIYTDKNGEWVSAYAPIFNSRNEVVGLVEADFVNNKYLLALRNELNYMLMFSLIGVGLSILISIFFSRLISQPIVQVARAAIEFSRGDFNQMVSVKSNDEIGTLARAFNYMVSEIRQKFYLQSYVSDSTLAVVKRRSDSEDVMHEKVNRTIFFSDVRGFTTFVERVPPEMAVSVINQYLSVQARTIKAMGGDVDKFVGDEVMAIFSGADAGLKAIRCALRVQEEIAQLKAKNNFTLDIGIGINSGYVVEGSIGSDDRKDHTVIGDAVNVAARLCSQAEGGEVLIGETIFRIVQNSTDGSNAAGLSFAPKGELQLKGKLQPLPVYAVSPA
ncbi:MAG: HAMP domain-containing protein [Rhizobacter sp.]|nr:HAMP domain-containing protein [Chlorobiales bacterium]